MESYHQERAEVINPDSIFFTNQSDLTKKGEKVEEVGRQEEMEEQLSDVKIICFGGVHICMCKWDRGKTNYINREQRGVAFQRHRDLNVLWNLSMFIRY